MKQRHAVIVLFALIIASSVTSFSSYSSTSRLVSEDMDRAFAMTMQEQQSDVISQDTIQVFNSHLQMEALRGKAVLAVATRQDGLRCEPKCSVATIFSMSDQRPASVLWTIAILWGFYCFWRFKREVSLVTFGGLAYSEKDGRFYNTKGHQIKLTPM